MLLFSGSLFSCSASNTASSKKLSPNEGLVYTVKDVTTNAIGQEVIIDSVENGKKTEILRFEGHPISVVADQIENPCKWLVIQVTDKTTDDLGGFDNIWLLDGRSGTYRMIFPHGSNRFAVDPKGETICVFDGNQPLRYPTLAIYDLATMKKLNEVSVESLKGTYVDTKEMSYANGIYKVIFWNDGNVYPPVYVPVKK